MSVDLNDIPTGNTIEFAVTFFLKKKTMAVLRYGEIKTLSRRFDSIGVGNGENLSIYEQETPGDITISPGNIAFVDRSVDRKIAVRYGEPDGTQKNIIYRLR